MEVNQHVAAALRSVFEDGETAQTVPTTHVYEADYDTSNTTMSEADYVRFKNKQIDQFGGCKYIYVMRQECENQQNVWHVVILYEQEIETYAAKYSRVELTDPHLPRLYF